MLRAFRSGGAAQIVGGAIVFAIIVVFVIQFRSGAGERTANLKLDCAARVRGECVSPKDFFAAYGLIIPRGIQAKQVRALKLRRKILEGLVERELLFAEAQRLGISISDEAVDDFLRSGRVQLSFPAGDAQTAARLGLGFDFVRPIRVKSTKTKKFDYEIYKRSIRNFASRSPKEFKEMERRELVARRMRDLVRARVRISEAEAFDEFSKTRSKAVVRVVRLERDWFGRWIVDSSDAVVDAWADSNKAQLDAAWKMAESSWTAGCPLVSEIFVPVEKDASDDEKKSRREKIDAAAERVADGEPFEVVAREVSEGGTAVMGGELGCLGEGYGEGATALLAAVAEMEPGAVSPVLETSRGFHLLRLDGKLAEDEVEKVGRRTIARRLSVRFAEFDMAKDLAGKILAAAKAGKKLSGAADELAREVARSARHGRKKGKKDEELPAMNDDRRPRVEVSAPFTPMGAPVSDALPGQAVAEKVFALEKAGDLLPDFILTQSGLAVVQLKEKTMASREEFDEDKETYVRGVLLAKQIDALDRYVAALRSSAEKTIELNPRYAEDPKPEGEDVPSSG